MRAYGTTTSPQAARFASSCSLSDRTRQEKEEEGKKFHKIEREYGKFVGRFALPTEVDASQLTAEFKEGVLNVHLPKSANGTLKAISVKVA